MRPVGDPKMWSCCDFSLRGNEFNDDKSMLCGVMWLISEKFDCHNALLAINSPIHV